MVKEWEARIEEKTETLDHKQLKVMIQPPTPNRCMNPSATNEESEKRMSDVTWGEIMTTVSRV
jgi:hypothetical protein